MKNEKARKVSRCLQGIAHELRLGILMALKDGEKSVNTLVATLRCSQPALSQHLSVMKDRGIVEARREGNQVFYRVTDRRIFELLKLVQAVFCE